MYNKYRAVKTEVDGIVFDSRKEASRYTELKILQRAGKIKNLRLQVPFEILPKTTHDGKTIRAVNYVADFVYIENGLTVVEDVKGVKTPVYNLKKKLVFLLYGITIKET